MSEGTEIKRPQEIPSKTDTGVVLDRSNLATVEIEKAIQTSGGRIPFSKFMEISLYGEHGYYSSGKVEIGVDKDFVTAPEHSDLFGATIGRGLMKTWEAMGKPSKFDVVEMGAGHGTMAHSLLYWTKKLYPEFHDAINYNILEYGTGLIPRQQEKLKGLDKKVNWVNGSAYEIPFRDVTGAFISNELPDTFPIDLVTLINGRVRQKYVAMDNNQWVEVWDEPHPQVLEFVNKHGIKVEEGVPEPINIQSTKFQAQLDQALKQGTIITIDYGQSGEVGRIGKVVRSTGDFQGREDSFEIYKNPGNVDVTASVNFAPMEQQATEDGLGIFFLNSQRNLLWKFGVSKVADMVREEVPQIKSFRELVSASRSMKRLNRLIGEQGMGKFYASTLFKGINPEGIDWDSGQKVFGSFETGIQIPLKLGRPNTGVSVSFPEDREVMIHGNYRNAPYNNFQTNEDGVLLIEPDLLEDSELTIAWTLEKIDLKDKKVLAELLEKSGITID